MAGQEPGRRVLPAGGLREGIEKLAYKAYLSIEINEEVPLKPEEMVPNALGAVPTAKVEQQVSFSTKAEGATLAQAAASALERAADLFSQVGPGGKVSAIPFGN